MTTENRKPVMSVIELEVLLHYYALPAEFPAEFPAESPAAERAHAHSVQRGLLVQTASGKHEITAKGRFYVDHVRRIPVPVEQTVFVIPDPNTP